MSEFMKNDKPYRLLTRREVFKSSATLLGSSLVTSEHDAAEVRNVNTSPSSSGSKIPVDAAQSKFSAIGPTQPVKRPPHEQGTVKVTFDLLPTTMQYDLPTHFFMVTENNIKFSNFAAETYDPRHWAATGAAASFEPLQDRKNRYVRVW